MQMLNPVFLFRDQVYNKMWVQQEDKRENIEVEESISDELENMQPGGGEKETNWKLRKREEQSVTFRYKRVNRRTCGVREKRGKTSKNKQKTLATAQVKDSKRQSTPTTTEVTNDKENEKEKGEKRELLAWKWMEYQNWGTKEEQKFQEHSL